VASGVRNGGWACGAQLSQGRGFAQALSSVMFRLDWSVQAKHAAGAVVLGLDRPAGPVVDGS
jgi:hypothetical protein